ncbi:MAG: phosphatase PAP2 family protein [Sphingomonas bacterium]
MRREHRPARTIRVRTRAELFDWLDARELEIVRRHVAHTEIRSVRIAALVLNRLSNGMLYPIVAVLVLVYFGRPMVAVIGVSTGSMLVAHLLYPGIKQYCARARPFERDPAIISLIKPLDRHSFPSGHAMTATAAFLPLSTAAPQLAPLAIVGILSIGWARLAAGHHYLSDVLVGALLGSAVAGSGMLWMLHVAN